MNHEMPAGLVVAAILLVHVLPAAAMLLLLLRQPEIGARLCRSVRSGWPLALGLGCTFAALAWLSQPSGLLWQLDRDIAALMQRGIVGTTAVFVRGFTHLGDPPLLWAVVVLVAIGLVLRRRGSDATFWLLTTALGGIWVRLLKSLFQRQRPDFDADWVAAAGYSFPSGHAAGATLVYGLAAVGLLGRHCSRSRALAASVLVMTALLIGFSRIALQVHFASDVWAGHLLAASWLAFCVWGRRRLDCKASGDGTAGVHHREWEGEGRGR